MSLMDGGAEEMWHQKWLWQNSTNFCKSC